MSSIYFEKGRNKYRAAFITPLGKRVTKRFNSKEDAEDWLANNRLQIKAKTFVEPSDVTIGEWLLTYMDLYKKNLRTSSYNHYLGHIKMLEPISSLPLQGDNALALQRFFNNLKLKPQTISLIKSLLNSAIVKAIDLGLMQKNYVKGIQIPKVPHHDPLVFTLEEVDRIKEVAKGYSLYPLIVLAINTGMRLGELVALHWVDYDGRYIHVKRTISNHAISSFTKTDSSRRDIILPDTVVALLDSMKEKNKGNPLIFSSRTGNALRYSAIYETWKKILLKADVPYRNFHVLRHTHASQLIASGIPITEISKRLGHKTIATTMETYSHAIKGNDSKMLRTLDKLFAPKLHP